GCSRRYPAQAGLAALCLVTIDLTLANAGLVITIPQTDFEQTPEVVQAIRAAERANPSPGPFRIHRLASWVPIGWSEAGSTQRLRDLVDWEIDTLQPRFGVVHGMSYLLSDESETVDSTSVSSLRRARILWNSLRHLGRLMDVARALFQIAPVSCD